MLKQIIKPQKTEYTIHIPEEFINHDYFHLITRILFLTTKDTEKH